MEVWDDMHDVMESGAAKPSIKYTKSLTAPDRSNLTRNLASVQGQVLQIGFLVGETIGIRHPENEKPQSFVMALNKREEAL